MTVFHTHFYTVADKQWGCRTLKKIIELEFHSLKAIESCFSLSLLRYALTKLVLLIYIPHSENMFIDVVCSCSKQLISLVDIST